MILTPQVEALEWDILALEAMVVMEDLAVDMEDLEVLGDLDLHLMVLECRLMASEEDMGELAHTAMVVQVLFMGCQDLVVRGDITHLLLLMVLKNLLMVPNHLLMVLSYPRTVLNLLMVMHLLHKLNPNQAMVLVQGQPMMQLLQLMLLLPTVFLLATVVSLLLSNSRVVSSSSQELSSNLEPSNNLVELSNNLEGPSSSLSSNLHPLPYLRLDQCNLCRL